MAELQTLFDGADLGVQFQPGKGDFLRITFAPWSGRGPAWKRTLEGMDVPAVFVFGKWDHWYNTPELGPALEAIAPIRDAHAKALLVGSSMGGHAALRLSGRLSADVVVAVSPQYCVRDEMIGHFDRQWTKYVPRIRSFEAPLNPAQVSGRLFVVYDDLHPLDTHHAALCAAAVPVEKVRLPLTGHSSARVIADLRMLPALLSVGESGTDHVAALKRTVTEQAHRSAFAVGYRCGLLPVDERAAYLARHPDTTGMPDARAALERVRADPADLGAHGFFHQHRLQERAAAVPGVAEMIRRIAPVPA